MIASAEHPAADDWPEMPDASDFQFTATEFLDTLDHLRIKRILKPDHIGYWEAGVPIELVYEAA